MLKLLGFFIIVTSSAKIGFDLSSKYVNRTKELKTLINVLEKIKAEISFSNCVVTEALLKASDVKVKTIKDMLQNIMQSIYENGKSLDVAFKEYLVEDDKLSLTNADLDEIGGFFSTLGNGDNSDEIKKIDATILNLHTLLQNSGDEEKRYVKLFRTSGLLAGFLIAVILA